MSATTIATVGIFVVLLAVIVLWSPLARGLIKEAVERPNEPCTFTRESGRQVTVTRKKLPRDLTSDAAAKSDAVGSGPNFKYALAATFVLTFLSLVALVALVFAPPSEQAEAVSGTCEKAFIFGFSALVGLIGGKALK